MEINPSLTDNDFVPSMSHSPPSTDAIEYFPDDPMSAYQRFGPPDLDNWLLTVVPQVTTLLSSVISMMLNPAMYLFPLLMEPPRYPLSKAQLTVSLQPQKDRKLSLVLLMFTTLKVLATVCFPDCHLCHPKLHSHHPEQSNHNPFSQQLNIHMANHPSRATL
ncbi:hypothetical protein MHU86_15514 [Fragilaria crotonensis]|nr:hypothetical protein MHU86_15514 [Fragilaria crotonensis]